MFIPGKEIVYKFKADKFELIKARPYLRNSLQAKFFGRFINTNEGTIIELSYKYNIFGFVFLLIWEVLTIAIEIFVFISLLTHKAKPASEGLNFILGILIMLSLPIFGLSFFIFGYKIAMRDQKIITKFLVDNCLAVIKT